MELDRQSGVPFYIQLKEQIRKRIMQGVWTAGTKLPTERELAEQLGVSRNTVSQAYKELEGEGVLSSSQGRGTFVADALAVLQQENRKEKVLRIIDVAMEEAVGLGFSIDDFVSFVHLRGMEKKEFLSRVKVGFVECNPEQLAEANWHLGPGVTLIPLLLTDLQDRRGRERLAAMDMIVTGVSHLNEVKSLLAGMNTPLLGISLQPKMETVVRVAKLPPGHEVALVCESGRFAAKVQEALRQAGLYPTLKVYLKPASEVLSQALAECGAIIVAPSFRSQVDRILPENMERIEFTFEPDAGSLNLLRGALLELKLQHREQPIH